MNNALHIYSVRRESKRHANRFALRTVDDYRAAPLEHATWNTHGRASWHRDLQLAASLCDTASDRLKAMVDNLTNAFSAHKDEDGVVALTYLRPLEAERLGKSAAQQVVAQLALLARREANRPHPFNAAAYFQSAIDWFKRIGDNAGAAAMLTELGETWERYGDATAPAFARYGFHQDAISAYRGVAGRLREADDIRAALKRARLKYEQASRDSIGEMISVHMPAFDATDLVCAATEHVQHEDPLQGVIRLLRA